MRLSPRRPAVLAATALLALAAPLIDASPATGTPPATARPVTTHSPSWRLLDTGSTSHFRGLSAVSRKIAWVGGYTGTVLRTTDGGATWVNVSPAGAETMQFRDITAFDAEHAVAMAAGAATDSRLYETTDGGASWQLAYQNTDPAAFFDCMSFSDAQHGLVLSDPVDGNFRILATHDGGASWTVLPNDAMPPALPGEAGFAASGECITTLGSQAWFGSGGGNHARVFHSYDGGRTWHVKTTPVASSASGGVFGLAFSRPGRGIAVGGSFARPANRSKVAAREVGNGPWRLAGTEPSGYRSGVAFVPSAPGRSSSSDTAIAVGLTGSDMTYDAGRNWTTFDTGQFDTVTCASDGSCWASGDLGRVAKLTR